MTISLDAPSLTYRVARDDDLDLLVSFREECGWGVEKIKSKFKATDRVFCVFQHVINGQMIDVGMGCWILDIPDRPEDASRELGNVYLDSLFIRQKYQCLGLGTKAIDILEREAVERYSAKYLTLSTTAYHCTTSEDGTYFVENFDTPGRAQGWYKKRGYKQYKDIVPLYEHPTPDDPNRKLSAMYLRKDAELVRMENTNQ